MATEQKSIGNKLSTENLMQKMNVGRSKGQDAQATQALTDPVPRKKKLVAIRDRKGGGAEEEGMGGRLVGDHYVTSPLHPLARR